MGKVLTISDEVYELLEKAAAAKGLTPVELLVKTFVPTRSPESAIPLTDAKFNNDGLSAHRATTNEAE
jgi:hypothetical protein